MRGTHFRSTEFPWIEHFPKGVPAQLSYPAEPIYWLLENAAKRAPERDACRYYDEKITYSQLLVQSRRMADALRRQGLEPGARVAILLPNIPEYLIALFGVWMAGGITVPLNPLMVAEEIADLLRTTDCRFIVCLDILLPLIPPANNGRPNVLFVTSLKGRLPHWPGLKYGLARLLRLGLRPQRRWHILDWSEALAAASPTIDPVRPDLDTPANILPTGGTTGRSKAVVLTHRNLLANAWQLYHWLGRPFEDDIVLTALPLFHSYGLMACGLTSIAMGATQVMHHRFQTRAILRLIERQRPTFVPAVPAMLAAFNKQLQTRHYDLSSVQVCISGGAPLDPGVAAEFAQRSGAIVVEGYGLSEASPVTHVGPLEGSARAGTIGLPLPDTDALIVDPETGSEVLSPGTVGELIIRGPQVMSGYWNDPAATAEAIRDGWLYTGDLATCDQDGFFRIVDRKKDLIITSGVNVYPTDVERVLLQFDGIEDVAIIGVPDAQRGELVKAVVVKKSGQKFSRHAFERFARQHLEVHKRPRIVEVVRGPLPRNMLGKILRRVLRDQHLRHALAPEETIAEDASGKE